MFSPDYHLDLSVNFLSLIQIFSSVNLNQISSNYNKSFTFKPKIINIIFYNTNISVRQNV
jgi:hypothetical protein